MGRLGGSRAVTSMSTDWQRGSPAGQLRCHAQPSGARHRHSLSRCKVWVCGFAIGNDGERNRHVAKFADFVEFPYRLGFVVPILREEGPALFGLSKVL